MMTDYKAIVEWIRDYTTSAGLKTLVVGVSGGVDSAVVSTLCAHTGLNVILLKMPLKSNKENTRLSDLHALELVKKFKNVSQIEVDLTSSYMTLQGNLLQSFPNNDLANANTKSRLRMISLYYAATCNNGLVVGTGNKVEDYGVGFFTKYGDGGVDISPIADLTKTEVRNLAKHLGVNDQIIKAPPTDGLWEDNRTDEEQIGVSYEELEWVMNHLESSDQRDLTSREKEVLKIYLKFHHKNKHKMEPIPTYRKKS